MPNLKRFTRFLTVTVVREDAYNFFPLARTFLENPVLFLSSYFKRHQEVYYEKLTHYHNGDVVSWVDFFLDVIEIANEAVETVDKNYKT